MSKKNIMVTVTVVSLAAAIYFGITVSRAMYELPTEQISHDYLVQHALELVNKDRKDNGLGSLALSANKAAQTHAEEILMTRTVSHWLTNGEKPYMTYARYGGAGGIGQNVAFRGITDIEQCKQSKCEIIDPIKKLEEIEYAMMFDDEYYEWGNKGNILDPNHTHVSFGIAYDEYSFVLVQNFEYNYINLTEPIGHDPNRIKIIGTLSEGRLYNISVYYDPFPTTGSYEAHKNEKTYGFGRQIAVVEPPLPPNSYYEKPRDYELIIAKNMVQDQSEIDVEFDMTGIAVEPGIYTLTVWLQINHDYVPATVYQIFIEPNIKDSI
ncbi:CAP domain-containing protein [Candidatus Nitrosotenuis uzonensis]|uniref:SCP domain-containing protein n=1 Tax=Candidatus Nitrosotenuis uzonensis TaxID=1407055 RepID=V6AUJ2_9ARCH|nr:CAP domain-containing protein [Candidatus Nitrosotenuis uzonensis]CDI06209.1 exported hypothetical protein [Candidatus Nitrosotenuis uzonensis]